MLNRETLYPLTQAVEKATGRKPHLSTVIRWTTRGSAGIRLESVMLGGRRLTSEDAVLRFTEAVTRAKAATVDPIVSPQRRDCEAERSAERLRNLLTCPTRR